jgi:hypothetical protein
MFLNFASDGAERQRRLAIGCRAHEAGPRAARS